MIRRTCLALAAFASAGLFLTGCAVEEPSVDGNIVDMHLTRASVDEECTAVSAVPYVEDCQKVRVPDKCYLYVENTKEDFFARAEVWCDAYDRLKVGDTFTDGTAVIDSVCAYKDDNGRWQEIAANDCAEYSAERRERD